MMDAKTQAVETADAKVESSLTEREKLYASGNRRRDNLAPKTPDPRLRSRLYGR